MDVIRRSLVTSLEIGAFFLQFLNSWNLNKSNYDIRDLPQVSAPVVSVQTFLYRSFLDVSNFKMLEGFCITVKLTKIYIKKGLGLGYILKTNGIWNDAT